jgi:uncharacterized membrane protein YraQ (UPF0718 family)
MILILETVKNTVLYVMRTLAHNSPALALGILVAAVIQVYIDPGKMKEWLMRRSSVSIPATVAFGAFTPFCACGTMAVVLAMLATALPWGPVMAFLTSSPLMSPEEFVMMSGILGPMFAVALAAASILIGLGSGYITHIIEKKTHFLDNQIRFASAKEVEEKACCASGEDFGCEEGMSGCDDNAGSCSCRAIALERPFTRQGSDFIRKYRIYEVVKAVFDIGIKRILPLFALFSGIGYLINQFVPTTWISALFGPHNLLAVPMAALIGLPLYVNGDSSIPLIQMLMQSGVSSGAMLAFMITGPGSSAGVLMGIATILKKKAIALYTVYLLIGAIVFGYAYNFLLMFL